MTAPRPTGSESHLRGANRTPASDPASPRRLRPGADAVLGLILAAGLATLAFTTTGGFNAAGAGAGDTWSEIAIMLLGAGACAAAALLGGRGHAWGGVTVALFAVMTALTALSIAWSVQPDYSWQDTGRTVAYLAAFAGAAALARVAPERWRVLVGALATMAAALSGWALLAKVFPAALASGDNLGRLEQPFGYWNAIGVTAALGLPPCLWAAGTRERSRLLRALAAPAITLLISVVVLSFSRSAVLVAVLGAGCWLALVPVRLRALAMLAIGAVGGAVISAWALATPALTSDNVALAARTSAGHSFGIVLVLVLGVTTAAGLAGSLAIDRVKLAERTRRRIGLVLVIAAAFVPVAGVVGLAASSRGLTGEISHVWSTLTSTSESVGDNAGRLGQLGNTRPLYWSEGITVGEHALLHGAGAEGYATARTAYTSSGASVQHAHSYVIQTFADFGLIGLAINLALLVAWCAAAARPLARRISWASLSTAQAAERQGTITLAVVVLAFGVQSAIDWTWFFAGVAIPTLVCAGWLAGRGPLTSPVGRAARRRPILERPGAGALVTALVALALVGAWTTWQPLRSADALSAAYSDDARGDPSAAFTEARDAADIDPVSITPLQILSSLYTAVGDSTAARAELVQATRLQPDNPQPWLWLGAYDLSRHQPRLAWTSLRRALALDRTDLETVAVARLARSELGNGAPDHVHPVGLGEGAREPLQIDSGPRVGGTQRERRVEPDAHRSAPGPREQEPSQQGRTGDRAHLHVAESELAQQRRQRAAGVQVQVIAERRREALDPAHS
jgi:hypothetical protein